MNRTLEHSNKEKQDRLKSIILTVLLSVGTLIALYFYKFSKLIPHEQVFTTMLMNFGDNTTGESLEEPATQDGSESSSIQEPTEDPQPKVEPAIPVEQKVIVGTNKNMAVAKVDKSTATKSKTAAKTTPTKSTSTPKKKAATTEKGDAKGTAAIGNLIRGRGTANGSQGSTTGSGNQGDPLGGSSSGDSKIGVDRKLIAYIPGTMGRGGNQPSHKCNASGTITISYSVDKSGNVTSARRTGGVSDPCVSSTSVSWVKQYVKAEKSTSSSTGTYRITF
ncbi:ferric siderophore ABC transporter substrate-binding protein [Chryseobacterium sp. A301]